MNHSLSPSRSATLRALLLGACGAAVVGCASTRLDAEWRDAGFGAGAMHGARVLVACDAFEVVIRQICQDQLASEVVARGATPVFLPADFPIATDRSVDAQMLPAAREADAKAMLVMTVAVAVNDVSPGFSIGVGGFGFGRSSARRRRRRGAARRRQRHFGLFGQRPGHRRRQRPPGLDREGDGAASSDVNTQMGELAQTVLGAADKAGLF